MADWNTFREKKIVVPQRGYQRKSHNKPAPEANLALLDEGAFCDVTFIVGPRKERIHCHQLFLKVRSPVFEAMFSERWNQDRTKEVPLEDVDPTIFRKFLEFVYSDNFVVSVPEASELLKVAYKYQVQALIYRCEILLALEGTPDDDFDVIQAPQ